MSYISIYGEPQIINGLLWEVQSAEKAHSITKEKNTYRFEVYQGEAREGKDEGKERSELSSTEENMIPYGNTIWTSYSFRTSSSSKWKDIVSIHGQFHAGKGSPNLSMRVNSYNQLRFYLRYGNSDNFNQKILYSTETFVPGKWYNIVIKSVFTPTTNGVIEIWINGTKKVSHKGVTGYIDSTGTYFKVGTYRSTSAPDFSRVYFSNIETGLKDLYSRVKIPLTIT